MIENGKPLGLTASEIRDGSRHKGAAFLAGMVAAMSMTTAMLILLLMGVTPRSLANIVSDRIAVLVGANVTEFFIQSIGPLGKELLFLTVLIGIVVVGGLLGLAFAAVTRRSLDQTTVWRNSAIMSGVVWLVFVGAGLPLLDQGFFGAGLGNDQISTLIVSILLFGLFGFVFGYAYLYLVPTEKVQTDSTVVAMEESAMQVGRRRFVAAVSGVFVVLVGAAVGTKAVGGPAISEYRTNLGDLKADGTLEGEITPTATFYGVSKNSINPKVDGASWEVVINGLVNTPAKFNLVSLAAMPQTKVYHTLTCISNPVGGDYIGNAEWTGVPLQKLLAQAGVKPGVKKLVFTCSDGYKDSITIEKANEPNTIFALKMNGETLTQDHGFPGRMLIPDIYGMKNAKWVTEMTLIDDEFEGFWQKQGWANVATINTEATIVAPSDRGMIKAGEKTVIRGFAYAGSRDIAKVEVSVDDGATWLETTVKPRLGPNAWTLWRLEWTPSTEVGKRYILKVRATEAGNKLQTPDKADVVPNGATGYHTISVQAA